MRSDGEAFLLRLWPVFRAVAAREVVQGLGFRVLGLGFRVRYLSLESLCSRTHNDTGADLQV